MQPKCRRMREKGENQVRNERQVEKVENLFRFTCSSVRRERDAGIQTVMLSFVISLSVVLKTKRAKYSIPAVWIADTEYVM